MSLTDADAALRAIFKKIYENRNKEIVYKQDVIGTIITWVVEEKPDMKIPRELIGKIYDLPSPYKRGKWIDNTYCSECGFVNEVESGFIGSVNSFNFCPNCGADMRGESE